MVSLLRFRSTGNQGASPGNIGYLEDLSLANLKTTHLANRANYYDSCKVGVSATTTGFDQPGGGFDFHFVGDLPEDGGSDSTFV